MIPGAPILWHAYAMQSPQERSMSISETLPGTNCERDMPCYHRTRVWVRGKGAVSVDPDPAEKRDDVCLVFGWCEGGVVLIGI
jgi:hypothetical protein